MSKKKKNILYIVQHRMGRSPGQRFRCEQYIPFLKDDGFDIEYSNIISEKGDKVFYSPGNYLKKLFIVLKTLWIRYKDYRKAKNSDIIFIYREAIMLGSTYFEKLYRKTNAKIIFDFDDSIWLNDVSEGNKNLGWMKKPSKTKDICKLADMVIVGNQYLADYASEFNNNVVIVPTTIDTSYHTQIKQTDTDKPVCIGWTGTSTTAKHFMGIEPVLEKIKEKYGNRVCFRFINNIPYKNEALELETTFWDKEKEIEQLSWIDIGIMPLPNDKWSNGKCGFKGLQYMALGIPTVMSPVGVNKDIIQNTDNGFLADTEDEWFSTLCTLIENTELRKSIGNKGRETVESFYSVNSQKNRYVSLFNHLIDEEKANSGAHFASAPPIMNQKSNNYEKISDY